MDLKLYLCSLDDDDKTCKNNKPSVFPQILFSQSALENVLSVSEHPPAC